MNKHQSAPQRGQGSPLPDTAGQDSTGQNQHVNGSNAQNQNIKSGTIGGNIGGTRSGFESPSGSGSQAGLASQPVSGSMRPPVGSAGQNVGQGIAPSNDRNTISGQSAAGSASRKDK